MTLDAIDIARSAKAGLIVNPPPVMSLPQISGYQLKSRLGQGAFGTVYQALWNGDFICAVKVLEEAAARVFF